MRPYGSHPLRRVVISVRASVSSDLRCCKLLEMQGEFERSTTAVSSMTPLAITVQGRGQGFCKVDEAGLGRCPAAGRSRWSRKTAA